MTNTQKILRLLQEAGSAGVHSFDIVRSVGTIRGAARINDLKKKGYKIISKGEKQGNAIGCRYFLASYLPKTEMRLVKENGREFFREVEIEHEPVQEGIFA